MAEVSFKTNARHIGQLGRELVTDFVTALVELIKNAYDADAECAKIIIEDTKSINGKIIIADCGMGMTIDDFPSLKEEEDAFLDTSGFTVYVPSTYNGSSNTFCGSKATIIKN